MSSAQDYPITFPYRATDGVYYAPTRSASSNPQLWIGPYHRGDDRYMPVGTPVVVNGLTIGLSGVTGAVSGPHLHIGEFESGVDVNPKGGGFDIPQPAHVQAIGEDSVNGKYVQIVDATAMLWVYLHLSEIYVVERQLVTKGADMPKEPEDLAMIAAKVIAEQVGGRLGAIDTPQYDAELKDGHLKQYIDSPEAAQDILGWHDSPEGQAYRAKLNLMYKSLDAMNAIAKAHNLPVVTSVADIDDIVAIVTGQPSGVDQDGVKWRQHVANLKASGL